MLILLKYILTLLSTEEIAGPQEPYMYKRGNVLINVILRRVCGTIVAVEKSEIVTHSECVSVALVI